MKLNPDCLRDVLLCLEENLKMTDGYKIQSISINQLCNDNNLSNYSKEDIVYSAQQLISVRFIDGHIMYGGAKSHITTSSLKDITWNGHQFLNDIRSKSVWEATKEGASKLGTMSVSALTMIASEITKKLVTSPEIIQKMIDGFMC